jgi:hypothetical protein
LSLQVSVFGVAFLLQWLFEASNDLRKCFEILESELECEGRIKSGLRRFQMDLVNAIQWPAMLVTVLAAWMVASQRKFKRNWGFWLFLLSNVLWIVWGLHDRAFALIFLQLCLAFLNVRGAMKNRPQETHR